MSEPDRRFSQKRKNRTTLVTTYSHYSQLFFLGEFFGGKKWFQISFYIFVFWGPPNFLIIVFSFFRLPNSLILLYFGFKFSSFFSFFFLASKFCYWFFFFFGFQISLVFFFLASKFLFFLKKTCFICSNY